MSLLLLQIGGEHYGLKLKALQEVADGPRVYSVPQGGEFLLGTINLHGRILPVIDLPALLGFAGAPRDQRLVVLSPEFHSLALAVSEVGRIVPFDAVDLQPTAAASELPAVTGVVEIAAQPVNLLDAGAIVKQLQNLYAV
jgi:purine-binding chemotaxis protein CheW